MKCNACHDYSMSDDVKQAMTFGEDVSAMLCVERHDGIERVVFVARNNLYFNSPIPMIGMGSSP